MKSFRVRPAASIAVAVATVLASGGLFAGPAAAAEPPSLHASPTPLLWPRSGLESVSATGPDDVWAAGYQGYQGFWWAWEGLGGTYVHVLQPKAVVTRWNGTSWQTHDLPGTGGDARAERIEAGAPGNVWVQGTLHPHHVFNGTAHYIARWDGARWRQVSLPSTDCRPRLEDADASGAWFDCSGDVFRWEGGTWTRYDTDPEGQSTGVSAISSLSAGSAWAATTENLLRWDGSRWSPAPGLPEGGYWYDVLAVSATEVWAAGLAPGTAAGSRSSTDGTARSGTRRRRVRATATTCTAPATGPCGPITAGPANCTGSTAAPGRRWTSRCRTTGRSTA